jgi:hypothetical protein
MKPKQITATQFEKETRKFLGQAQRGIAVVRAQKGRAILLRGVSEEELAEELLLTRRTFRESIRRARRNRRQGRGVPLKKVREML